MAFEMANMKVEDRYGERLAIVELGHTADASPSRDRTLREQQVWYRDRIEIVCVSAHRENAGPHWG